MISDIALFWLVLAGLLFVDNLVLTPAGGDHLRFGLRGRVTYSPQARFQMLQRDLILLNPLNPFDRIVLTQRCAGPITASQWRESRCALRSGLNAANYLSLLGGVYLISLVSLAIASLSVQFEYILLCLGCVHLVVWTIAAWILLRSRAALGMERSRSFSLALEAILVPGYLVNLGKRVWSKRQLDLGGLAVGLHQLKRMPACEERELYQLRLTNRLQEVADALDLAGFDIAAEEIPQESLNHKMVASSLPIGQWFIASRKCLAQSSIRNASQ